ncbi:MAG TPA: ABC transporter ATP-binding protein, partial [Thermoanaerobacterales bacterium]|nr:ABC transporter ATP-binding protein [Thermoanaerobacterales bacterium]
MSKKIEVNNLVKIFGSKPRQALRRLKEGWSKEKILKTTGQTVGVDNASFFVDDG